MAFLAQIHAMIANIVNIIPEVTGMLPKPARGDTNPPTEKPMAPRNADAMPALSRSQSIARELDAVNDIPAIASNRNRSPSYIQKLQPEDRETRRSIEIASIP